jgi:hypothetical protein
MRAGDSDLPLKGNMIVNQDNNNVVRTGTSNAIRAACLSPETECRQQEAGNPGPMGPLLRHQTHGIARNKPSRVPEEHVVFLVVRLVHFG